MKYKFVSVIVLAPVLLSACVSVTEPVSMGEGKYLITLNARGGFKSDGELLAKTIGSAQEFCGREGKEAKILGTENDGVQGWTPQTNQITFECIEK